MNKVKIKNCPTDDWLVRQLFVDLSTEKCNNKDLENQKNFDKNIALMISYLTIKRTINPRRRTPQTTATMRTTSVPMPRVVNVFSGIISGGSAAGGGRLVAGVGATSMLFLLAATRVPLGSRTKWRTPTAGWTLGAVRRYWQLSRTLSFKSSFRGT